MSRPKLVLSGLCLLIIISVCLAAAVHPTQQKEQLEERLAQLERNVRQLKIRVGHIEQCLKQESALDEEEVNPDAVKKTLVSKEEKILANRLAYLHEIPEIDWIEIEDNNVYIGFNSLPEDWRIIVNAAAVHGNKAINFGCHAWAVDARYRGWRPGDGPFYGEASARYGKLEEGL